MVALPVPALMRAVTAPRHVWGFVQLLVLMHAGTPAEQLASRVAILGVHILLELVQILGHCKYILS